MPKLVWRGFSVVFGICAIAWAVVVFPIFRAEIPLIDAAQRMLSGDKFNVTQLAAMRGQLQASPGVALQQASALQSAAVIRLQLMEDEWRASNRRSATDLAELQEAVNATLAQSPTNSFMWLVDLWLKRLRAEDRDNDLTLLRLSYWYGPNEAWIATRRSPLALNVFSSLPSELAEQVVSEFTGLVKARLHVDAAEILAGPGWAFRERLLSRLLEVDEDNRRVFARILASKGVDGVTVPGVRERPFRTH
jgi:hypothetical protein